MPHKGYNGQMAMLRRETERKSDDLREEIHGQMMVWVTAALICCVVGIIVTIAVVR